MYTIITIPVWREATRGSDAPTIDSVGIAIGEAYFEVCKYMWAFAWFANVFNAPAKPGFKCITTK